MTIACLGWGSLVWDPGLLPVLGEWREDGPSLPLEFARHSSRDRITLVIAADALPSVAMWAELNVPDLAAAVQALAKREGTGSRNIGSWPPRAEQVTSVADVAVAEWAREKGMTAVVWTALPPKWRQRPGQAPTLPEALEHLSGLSGETLAGAVEYIRRAPPQIETRYRRLLLEAANRISLTS